MKTFTPWILLLALQAPVALAAEPVEDSGEPLELREIMREMSRDMQAITRALVLGDWPGVIHHAEQVADHGKPPLGERVRILTLIKRDAGEFRALDGRVVEAAETLAEAARRADARQSTKALGDMTAACLACHTRFRERIINHFYE